jgi:tetratricopeptide (TPR) repeat protein
LRSGDPSCQGQQILGECLFLLGRAEVQTLPPPPPLDPFDITAIAWPPLDGGLDRYLDWLPAEPPPTAHHEAKTHPTPDTAHHEAKDHPAPDTAHHEAKGQPNPDTAHHEAKDQPTTPESGWLAPFFHRDSVRLKQAEWPITHQLRAIGTSVGMKVKIEPKAEEKLAAISMAIDLERAPLSAVLTSLTRKYGFSWRIADGVIAIEPAGHPNETAQRELALQMLRQGLAFAPEHPRARAARINAANLDLGAGRRRKAAVEYRQFLEIEPHAAESVYATYNLGLIELSNENWPVAQARFLDTIDRGPESKWADLGWWWLGRTQLDTGDTTAARKPFQIAREAKTRVVAAAAELGTAACALLEGEDEEVREILRSHRVNNRESHAAMADFFESLLRYRNSPSETRGKRVADALLAIGEGRLLGPAGFLLAGQAYREIGRYDRAAGLYDAAVELVRGPLAVRMTFEAAERYDQLDLRVEARKRYTVVAAVDQETWGLKAELRLADLAIRDRHGEECIRRCRALIGRKGIDSAEVLALMGRGYEFLKQYRLAAECFAGRVPLE